MSLTARQHASLFLSVAIQWGFLSGRTSQQGALVAMFTILTFFGEAPSVYPASMLNMKEKYPVIRSANEFLQAAVYSLNSKEFLSALTWDWTRESVLILLLLTEVLISPNLVSHGRREEENERGAISSQHTFWAMRMMNLVPQTGIHYWYNSVLAP